MRVLLDDQPCETEGTTIGEAIAGAAALAGERGRVVVEVCVDGAPWTASEIGSPDLSRRTADEISLVSTDLRELVAETLTGAAGALTEADDLQRAAAKGIQANEHAPAMQKLGEALSIWSSVREAVVKACEATRIDLEALRIGDESVRTSVDLLHDRLRTVRAALEADDPVALSDTLLYDLPETVVAWREMIQGLVDHVRAGDGPLTPPPPDDPKEG